MHIPRQNNDVADGLAKDVAKEGGRGADKEVVFNPDFYVSQLKLAEFGRKDVK